MTFNPNLRLPPPNVNYVYTSSGYPSPGSTSSRSSVSSGSSSAHNGNREQNSASLSPITATLPPLNLPTPKLGPLAQPVNLPPLPKAGRKPLTTPPKDNRQRQNREAQRTYRRNQREEMQTLRDKESYWTKTAREGRNTIEDIIRMADQLSPELKHRLQTHGLERLYDDLSRYANDAPVGNEY